MPVVTAVLRDPGGKPLGSVEVDLVQFSAKGTARILARDKADPRGRVVLRYGGSLPDPQPRLALRMQVGTQMRRLSETPQSTSPEAVEFGMITVRDAPVVRLGSTEIFGIAGGVPDLAPGPAPEPSVAARIKGLEDEIKSHLRTTERLRSTHAAALEQLRASHTAALAERDARIAKLQTELARAQSRTEAETSLVDLFDTTASQIETAARTIAARRGAYQLGDISMELKVVPGASGAGVSFVPRAELGTVTPEILSRLTFSFTASGPAPEAGLVDVPDLLGYTRAPALRKLSEAGLEAVWREEMIRPGGGPSQHGRIIDQSPAAGTALAPGGTVTLTLARED